MSSWQKLGEILQQTAALPAQSIDEALQRQQQEPQRLGQILLNHHGLSASALVIALAKQSGLDYLPQLPPGCDPRPDRSA